MEDTSKKEFELMIKEMIEFFDKKYEKKIQVKEQIVERRQKASHFKVFLHFSAGEQKNNLLLNYYRNNRNFNIEMLNCIERGVEKSCFRGNCMLEGCTFQLTERGNAINCFQSNRYGIMDEYELEEELMRMRDKNLCGYNFEMPK